MKRTISKSFSHVGRGRTRRNSLSSLALAACTVSVAAHAQTMKAPDITKVPTLYVVPYAHLDTQWRWEFPQSISEFLLKTLRVNFDYIDKYPHYVFNWTGANRYRLMKEYFPADYARMKQYVAAGRWYPAGSSVEEGDVNLPSAEGIFRQVLYGNAYFRSEFGKASAEYMLPDCFGFPASLPTILAHSGVKGFSTQKLNASWQPAPKVGGAGSPEQTPEGIPFNVGRWYGTDGTYVVAAVNPGSYNGGAYTDLSKSPDADALKRSPQEPDWPKRIALDGSVTGVFADYHYVGTGDIGGATTEATVKLLEAIVTKSSTALPPPRPERGRQPAPEGAPGPEAVVGTGPVHVVEATADQLFNDLTPDETKRMPEYKGDLELINHSAGSLTSEAFHKRSVVKNEVLADAAEKASVMASWMGARAYPQERLNQAWMLALGGHFHDTAAGTATPRSYEFAWNDDVLVANQFAGVLADATEAIASGLDTQGAGVPVVIYNTLNIAREDVVEASVKFPGAMPASVRVTGADGREVPSQVENGKVVFVASAPSVGYSVYNIVPGSAGRPASALHVTANSLENDRYRVALNGDGDVSSVFDKSLKKELLSAPIRLAISTDTPKQWPAWNMDFDQEQAAPRSFVSGPAQVRIVENGPARIGLEVTRKAEGSTFVQTIRLSAGDAGNRVEFGNAIDWRTLTANLKATIPLAASNGNATYNWDVGTVERPNAFDRQFEVASHRWIDLTDTGGAFGATVLTDAKNGSDKRDDHTIRLTLLRSPGLQPGRDGRHADYSDQANQDWGHHEFTYGLAGHAGDWRAGQTDWQGYRLNDPLIGFQTAKHAGSLGKTFSLARISNPRVRMLALKKAERSDEFIVRMVELDGRPANDVKLTFAGPLAAAREVNAQELPLDAAKPVNLVDGALVTSFTAYQPRTFALKFGAQPAQLSAMKSQPVSLTYDLAVASNDDTQTAGGGFDGKGNALPAEMLPTRLDFDGMQFVLGASGTGVANAVTAKGQTIDLPAGGFNRVYVLAASDGDRKASFKVGGQTHEVTIENWGGFIGQWDTRIWKNWTEREWASSAGHQPWPPEDFRSRESYTAPRWPEDYVGLTPGYVKPAGVAWFASHHHTAAGLNEPYQYSYLFAYPIDIPAGAKSITLPSDDKVRILAISVAQASPTLTAVQPLADTLGRTEPEKR